MSQHFMHKINVSDWLNYIWQFHQNLPNHQIKFHVLHTYVRSYIVSIVLV